MLRSVCVAMCVGEHVYGLCSDEMCVWAVSFCITEFRVCKSKYVQSKCSLKTSVLCIGLKIHSTHYILGSSSSGGVYVILRLRAHLVLTGCACMYVGVAQLGHLNF